MNFMIFLTAELSIIYKFDKFKDRQVLAELIYSFVKQHTQ